MKKKLIIILFGISLLFMVACSAKHYTIHTAGGEKYLSIGKPEYNEKSDSVIFENPDGQKIVIQKKDIKKVVEHIK